MDQNPTAGAGCCYTCTNFRPPGVQIRPSLQQLIAQHSPGGHDGEPAESCSEGDAARLRRHQRRRQRWCRRSCAGAVSSPQTRYGRALRVAARGCFPCKPQRQRLLDACPLQQSTPSMPMGTGTAVPGEPRLRSWRRCGDRGCNSSRRPDGSRGRLAGGSARCTYLYRHPMEASRLFQQPSPTLGRELRDVE